MRLIRFRLSTTVRPISDLSELYFQFSEYRLEILEDRIREQLKTLRDNKRNGRTMRVRHFKRFLKRQEEFLAHMNREIVEDQYVIKGEIDDSHRLTSEDSKEPQKKRRRVG